MSANRDHEEEIFDAARELAAEERAAYLAERCGQDADLRQRIEGMLAAERRPATSSKPMTRLHPL